MIGPHSNHPDGDELPSPCIGEGIQLALRLPSRPNTRHAQLSAADARRIASCAGRELALPASARI